MEARPGTYALILESTRNADIQIGRLGHLSVRPGFYIYVGSAFGPGGLRARVGRHCNGATRRRWHIDYLHAVVPVRGVWYSYDPERREQLWAKTFMEMPGLSVPLPGFGASDHRGASHLFFSSEQPALNSFIHCLDSVCSDHAPVWLKYGTELVADLYSLRDADGISCLDSVFMKRVTRDITEVT